MIISNIPIGDYFLETHSRALIGPDSCRIQLRPKTYQTLLLLLYNNNKITSKEQFHRVVWRKAIVTDDSLVQCIAELRKILGDRNKTLIKTISKSGYMLCAEPSADEVPTDELVSMRMYAT